MELKVVVIRLLKSPLGLLVLGLSVVLAFIAVFVGHLPILVVLPLFCIIALIDILVLIQTKAGIQSVVAESNRERQERDARILGGIAAARKRLSLLRLPEGPVKTAIERLIYVGGLYLEETVKGKDRDPLVEDAILSSLEIVDEYLHRLDVMKSGSWLTGQDADSAAEAELTAHTAEILQRSVDEVYRRLEVQQEEKQHIASGDLLS
jgi:hypothetical protein